MPYLRWKLIFVSVNVSCDELMNDHMTCEKSICPDDSLQGKVSTSLHCCNSSVLNLCQVHFWAHRNRCGVFENIEDISDVSTVLLCCDRKGIQHKIVLQQPHLAWTLATYMLPWTDLECRWWYVAVQNMFLSKYVTMLFAYNTLNTLMRLGGFYMLWV